MEHEIRRDITALHIAAAASCMNGKAVMDLYEHFERNLSSLKAENPTGSSDSEPQSQMALSAEEFRKQLGVE
jgi:hypothetical protein